MDIFASISKLIDFFYPPFKSLVSVKTFRYAACGGSNMVFDYLLYTIFFHFVFVQEIYTFFSFAFLPRDLAYYTVFPITLFTGFLLNRYVVFQDFSRRKRIQMFRYFMVVLMNFFLNKFMLQFFTDFCGLNSIAARGLCYPVTILISYFIQVYFTFNGSGSRGLEENSNNV